MSTLPDEIWLSVFEMAVAFSPDFIDLCVLRDGRERNRTLASCALVCRSWAPLAQKVLFRDISLGVVTVPPREESGDSDHEDEDDYWSDEEDGGRKPTGETAPSLWSLIATLRALRERHSPIPDNVRALHVTLGRTGGKMEGNGVRALIEEPYVNHCSPTDVARAVSLCPRLLHLSITIGATDPETDGHNSTAFNQEDFDLMGGTLSQLRQLSIRVMSNFEFCEHWLTMPRWTAGHQLIRVTARSLLFLQMEVYSDIDDPDEPHFDDVRELPDLPRLRSLVIHQPSYLLSRAVSSPSRAPNLEIAQTYRHTIPVQVKHLRGFTGGWAALRDYPRLESVDLGFYKNPNTLAAMLDMLPRTIREVTINSKALLELRGMYAVDTALRNATFLESVVIVHEAVGETFVRPEFCLPVRVVYKVPWPMADIVSCQSV
ncbi:hypothetical protein EXIGLDRAFT_761406 [Exidia glandulosa HHB12029]|uniref:Uncharacterized protein n=1 Tax=Exidia glandulosa HHB12029 TaxID=1314781 RepID=A0A165NK14_EXIGL|nr:hypothetical protein EXIGLDRAFT_761406 [Exidia glandulosa HHB12029]